MTTGAPGNRHEGQERRKVVMGAQAAAGTGAGINSELERHYTVAEVAEMWGLSETKVRHLFRDAPGVLQTKLRTLRPRKRQHVGLRIPESVLIRVHGEMAISARWRSRKGAA
jgi:hypothetical protein